MSQISMTQSRTYRSKDFDEDLSTRLNTDQTITSQIILNGPSDVLYDPQNAGKTVCLVRSQGRGAVIGFPIDVSHTIL